MEIKTNHNWREFVPGYALTDSERAEFDYLDETEWHDFKSSLLLHGFYIQKQKNRYEIYGIFENRTE